MRRKIDALVAEHVMGFRWRRNIVSRSGGPDRFPVGKDFLVPKDEFLGFNRRNLPGGFRICGDSYHFVPSFSEFFPAAFRMEDKIEADGKAQEYSMKLRLLVGKNDQLVYWNIAHATPEQRCKAALRAYGVKYGR